MRKILYIFVAMLFCSCHVDYLSLGDSYVLIEDSSIEREDKEGYLEMLIPNQVLNEDYDKSHIIAYQKPDSDYLRRCHIDIYKYLSLSDSTMHFQHKADSLEVLLDSMLEIRDCYWIIRKKDCKVFGPMTESDFNQECKKRNIKLKMDKKYERRFRGSY